MIEEKRILEAGNRLSPLWIIVSISLLVVVFLSIPWVMVGIKNREEIHKYIEAEISEVKVRIEYNILNDLDRINDALNNLTLYTQEDPSLYKWFMKDRSRLALLIVEAYVINNDQRTWVVETTGCDCHYLIEINIDSVEDGDIEIISPRLICQPLCIIWILPERTFKNTEFIYIIEKPFKAVFTYHVIEPVECHECQNNQTTPCLNYLGIKGKFTVQIP